MMIRLVDMMRGAGLAALLLAPLPAAAQQPAPWADESRETTCVYDGIMTTAGHGGADAARIATIVAGCRQRFGWTEAQGRLGALTAQAMIEMRLASAEAVDAGVDRAVISAAFATFSQDDFINLQLNGAELAEGSRDIARRAAAQVAAHGIRGDAADKAARAVVLQLIAARILAEFTVELSPENQP